MGERAKDDKRGGKELVRETKKEGGVFRNDWKWKRGTFTEERDSQEGRTG